MVDLPQELWQAYDERGEPLAGVSLTKQQARQGALHAAAHVWIWRGQGADIEILLQRRARDKQTWPGHLDISAAGHIRFGETPLLAAIRETAEELALTVKPEDLHLLFVHRMNVQVTGTEMVENEFQWIYAVKMAEVDDTPPPESEVESLAWVSIREFKQLVLPRPDQQQKDRVVPHSRGYFMTLLEALTRPDL